MQAHEYPFTFDIAFYGSGISFSGETPIQKDLGGAEYCVVSMAEALARRGHTIIVFTPDSLEVYQGRDVILHNGVHYLPLERSWRSVCHSHQWDVFVVSRDYRILSNTVLTSKLLVLWNHDILSDPDTFREHVGRADKIYCLSQYHKQQYLRQLTDPQTGLCTLKREHISLTRNGVNLETITQALYENKDEGAVFNRKLNDEGKFPYPSFIYCSRPERGLLYLLRDLWPQILERWDNARLCIAFYDVSEEQLPESIKAIHLEVYKLLWTAKNVDFLGALPRKDLFRITAASWGILYSSIFPEISCLSILESQALGTPALTSNRGALPESNWTTEHVIFDWEKVEHGDMAHMVDCADWITGFLEHYWDTGEVEERRVVQEEVQKFHDWNAIAEEWEADFMEHFEGRSSNKSKRVIQNLIYHSDLLAAKAALESMNTPQDDRLSSEEWHALNSEVIAHLTYHHEDPEMYATSCGDEHEDIHTLPDRMRVALELIEQKFGHEKPFTLIDCGVGAGRMLYHVLKNFHNCQVLGFDFSLGLCLQARKNITDAFPALAENISFIQHCDILSIPPPEESMKADVVWAGEFLEHQVEPVKTMTVIDSWCKEGGLVIYSTPYGPWEAISFGSQHTKDGHEIRAHVSHFEHRDFQEMFKEVEYRLQATYIQHSPLDNSLIGNYVLSYEKLILEKIYPHKDAGTINDPGPVIVRYKQPQFYLPDYHRKFITTRPYVRIGGLLITKDEEDNITRALKPLVKRIDHILVYDTGSQDKTTELASQYATEVVHGYWDDDFAAARNRALSILVTHDVDQVFWQDADEEAYGLHKLRFYLQGDLKVYQGAIICQNSVMLDAAMTKDIPIRLFRNKPNYTWYGCIHEQIQDLTDPTGNTSPFPLIILPDVQIVHYGFVTEDTRRNKARYRNYELLKKDRELHPERKLGLLLLLRDYLHHVKWWHIQDKQPLRPKDIELLYDIINKYSLFPSTMGLHHVLARQFCQEALEILGKAKVPGPDGDIPIHTALLIGGMRGQPPTMDLPPQFRWFRNTGELQLYVYEETRTLCERLDKPRHIFED